MMKSPPRVQDQYRTAAYSAAFVRDPKNAAFYKYFIHHSFFAHIESPFLAAATRVLDLGCGDGVLSRLLYRQNNALRITAIDLSAAMLQAAQDLSIAEKIPESAISYVLGDVLATSLPAREFDLVVSGFVACHLLTQQALDAFFVKAFEALKPGGRSVHLLTPAAKDAHASEGQVQRVELAPDVVVYDTCWSDSMYENSAKSAGFENIRIMYAQVAADGEREMGTQWKREMEAIGYKTLCCSRPN